MFRTVFSTIVKILNVLTIVLLGTFCILRLTGHVPYIVQSGSMSPVISTGALAFVNTNDRDVAVGDIITFKLGGPAAIETGNGTSSSVQSGQAVTHRLISIDGDYLYTKGDANDTPDLVPVHKSQLIGTYMFQIPKVGFLLAKTGRIIWFLFGGMLLFLNIASALLSGASREEPGAEEKQDENQTIHEGN